MIDVIDTPSETRPLPLSPSSDCILKVTPSFSTVEDVWRVLVYLMPSKLRALDEELTESTNVQNWLAPLVRFEKSQDANDGQFKYQMSLARQDCDQPGLTIKLRKMGIDYHLVKLVKSLEDEENDDQDDAFYQRDNIAPTRTVEAQTVGTVFKRRHARRHAMRTPELLPAGPGSGHFSTVTILGPESLVPTSLRGDEVLTRVVPSFASPIYSGPLLTSLLPNPGLNANPNGRMNRPMRSMYPTPIGGPSMQSTGIVGVGVDGNNLVTPTPSFVFRPVLRTPTVSEPSSSVASVRPEDNDIEQPAPSRPEVATTVVSSSATGSGNNGQNSPPVIKKRVRKLSVHAGKWWKFTIPPDTFYDMEDGYTRDLELGFYLEAGVAPAADFWIQFNSDNQFLFALPTENNVGKHKFLLTAMDKNGNEVSEHLEVHVRQLSGVRSFHHQFTLFDVSWDSVKYPVLIEATEKLLLRIAQQVYNDRSVEPFAIQAIDQSSNSNSYTISWTNDTLPHHPCPRAMIHKLYEKLGDLKKQTDGVSIAPSKLLAKVLGSEFKVRGVGLRLLANCGGGPSTEVVEAGKGPEVRNAIDMISVGLGDVLRFAIPEDTFVSPKGGNTRELELSVLTIDGHSLPLDGPVGFHVDAQELFGLAIDAEEAGRHEFQVIAREPGSSATAREVFVVEFAEQSSRSGGHSFEMTTCFLYQSDAGSQDLDLESRIKFMYRMATGVLSDSDPSMMRVISLKKYRYVGASSQKPSRSKREQPMFYYEAVWTNKSELLSSSGRGCPSEPINDNIVNRIFKGSEMDKLSNRLFEPDFRLLYIGFKAVGKCAEYMHAINMGELPVNVVNSGVNGKGSKNPALSPDLVKSSTLSPNVDTLDESEYYVSSILPALVTIAVMLVISLVIVIILVRYRRNQDKTRFDVHTVHQGHQGTGSRTPGDGYPTEREAFLGKGRVPVIFEQELQQHELLARQQQAQSQFYGFSPQVIMPPNLGDSGNGGLQDNRSGHLRHHQTPPVMHHQLHQVRFFVRTVRTVRVRDNFHLLFLPFSQFSLSISCTSNLNCSLGL